jgi:hypothetical protein
VTSFISSSGSTVNKQQDCLLSQGSSTVSSRPAAPFSPAVASPHSSSGRFSFQQQPVSLIFNREQQWKILFPAAAIAASTVSKQHGSLLSTVNSSSAAAAVIVLTSSNNHEQQHWFQQREQR